MDHLHKVSASNNRLAAPTGLMPVALFSMSPGRISVGNFMVCGAGVLDQAGVTWRKRTHCWGHFLQGGQLLGW